MKNQGIIYLDNNLEVEDQQDVTSEPQGYFSNYRNKKLRSIQRQSNPTISKTTIIYLVVFLLVILAIQIFVGYLNVNKKIATTEKAFYTQLKKKSELDEHVKNIQKEKQKIQQEIELLKKEYKIALSKKANSQKTLQPMHQNPKVDQSEHFIIPKHVWVYLQKGLDGQNYISKLGFQNIKHYATKSSFELRVVDKSNFKTWLNQDQTKELEDLIRKVESQPSIGGQINHIRQQVIMLYLMKQLGGVMINYKLILAEPLDWIKTIHKEVHVNIGNKNVKPKYFAFFYMDAGPRWEKMNRDVQYEIEKLVYAYPGITDGFLAGVAKGQFLNDMYKNYIKFVCSENQERITIINSNQIKVGSFNPQDYYHLYTISAQMTVQLKQRELDASQNQKFYKFAIDYYGLISMNENYAIQKMQILFKNRLNTRNYFDNFYNYLAKLPQSQFQEVAGPLRYVINPDPYNSQFNNRLQKHKNNQGYDVWEGSFIHRHLFLGRNESVKANKERSVVAQTFSKWESLPKKVWLFWDKGIDNASAGNQLCALNIIKNAELAGFQVFKVDDKNLKDYIPQKQIKRIEQTIKNAKFPLPAQLRSDFIRLALIINHGGIYMDVSYIWFQSFDWFVNVAKEPSHYIFNRFGQHPKVMFQFHSLEGAPFDWQFDEKSNTKASWHLAYENNLILAEKDNQFIKEWYELFHTFTVSNFDVVEKKLNECNTNSHRWTQPHDRYLTAMDALKAVVGCRQKMIESERNKYPNINNAADYYKIWSFNGFNGLQKFRYYNDYTFAFNGIIDNEPHALYKSSIAFNDATIGKVYKGIKMYSWNIRFMNTYLGNNRHNNFESESHPNSYFHKYVFNKQIHEFFISDQLHVRLKK